MSMWVILLLAAIMTMSIPCSTAAMGPSFAMSPSGYRSCDHGLNSGRCSAHEYDLHIQPLTLEIFQLPGRPKMAVAEDLGRNPYGKLDSLLS